MRRHRHIPSVGDGRDLAQFGQTAAHRIGLQDRQLRIFEKRFEIETREMRLAADDAQIERLGDTEVAGVIVRHHRLFEPVHVIVLKLASHLNGDVGGPAHVDVDHDGDVRADRLAHAPHIVEIGGEARGVGDLHLDRLVATLLIMQRLGDHAVAAGAAEAARAIGRQFGAIMPP